MRVNLPIVSEEYEIEAGSMLVSTTDLKGHITHCNAAFVEASGYLHGELVGQPHNVIRHPDMPQAAFKDLWRTVGRGHSWTGLVKNRRKSGGFYWVQANVTPIMDSGKPCGYMSVRVRADPAQVRRAQVLYAQMCRDASAQRAGATLQGGQIMHPGLRGWLQRLRHRSATQQLSLLLLGGGALALLPVVLAPAHPWTWLGTLLALLASAGGVLGWFHHGLVRNLRTAERFARDLAACNLTTVAPDTGAPPLDALARSLYQIQVNLSAVVGDVRTEVGGLLHAAQRIAQDGHDLYARTGVQSDSLAQAASAMEELSSTVRQTAETATRVAQDSAQSAEVARRGGAAVQQVGQAMQAIEASSHKVGDIITVIEGIAFQTNLLALNAAVEAARAGEQGRGFAVVAGEVRALAQRSAGAASEIRNLIRASVDQVAEGSRQMAQAGATMAEVVDSVARVSTLMEQISHATTEQSVGIAQANESVTCLQQLTAQNAALVEQSASSAAELEHNSGALARSVQVFHLR